MRFIGLDETPTTPTPTKQVSDENSFVGYPPMLTTGVSPAPVLSAQNLVFAEIMSEKLLHPPGGVGTGVDDMSHAAVQEGSVRPLSIEAASTNGNRSLAEKSFEVFRDQEGEDDLETADVLPEDLTKPIQDERWNVPASRDERNSPVPRLEEPERGNDKMSPETTRHAQVQQRITKSEPSASHDPPERGSKDEPDTYDAHERLVQPSERPYHQSESLESSSDRFIEPNSTDHEYPKNNPDDEELSEEYDEDNLHYAGYYSQNRTGGLDEEYYHSDEMLEEPADYEEDETENESSEDESVRGHSPVVVDLTLDSDEEEASVSWRMDETRKHSEDQTEESDEEELAEEPEEGGKEFVVVKFEEESWTETKSRTPLTDLNRLSQNQSPQLDQFLLDPTLLRQFSNTVEQSAHFNFDSIIPEQSQNVTQPDVTFSPELLAQSLDPIVLQQSTFHPLPNEFIEPATASFLDSVLSFSMDPTTLSSNLSTEPPIQDSTVISTQEVDTYIMSKMQASIEESSDKRVQEANAIITQEFLIGLVPMTSYEGRHGEPHEQQQAQEFLPGIVPNISTESYRSTSQAPLDTGERRLRSEIDIDMEVTAASVEVGQLQAPIGVVTETQNEDISIDRPVKMGPESQEEPTSTTSESSATQFLRSGTPPPIPDAWRVDGLTTDLGYYPPLVDIVPPSLCAQKEKRVVDVIGVIRRSGHLGKSKGPDYVLPLHLVDPSTGTNNGVSTLLFRPYESALPVKPVIGSVIVLTNMMVSICFWSRLIRDSIS